MILDQFKQQVAYGDLLFFPNYIRKTAAGFFFQILRQFYKNTIILFLLDNKFILPYNPRGCQLNFPFLE
jgi:hypothetical protein